MIQPILALLIGGVLTVLTVIGSHWQPNIAKELNHPTSLQLVSPNFEVSCVGRLWGETMQHAQALQRCTGLRSGPGK